MGGLFQGTDLPETDDAGNPAPKGTRSETLLDSLSDPRAGNHRRLASAGPGRLSTLLSDSPHDLSDETLPARAAAPPYKMQLAANSRPTENNGGRATERVWVAPG